MVLSKKRMSRRPRHLGMIFGVGVNDSPYPVHQLVNEHWVACPFYSTWRLMIRRCYDTGYQRGSHVGCSVCAEWLLFTTFRAWMEAQPYQGNQLDKDIKVPGNKIYGPDTCLFVPYYVNSLLNDQQKKRGKYPRGVSINKGYKRLQVRLCKHGKQKHLGWFDLKDVGPAEDLYRMAKAAHIREVADTQPPEIKTGLYKHASLIGHYGN